MVAPMLSQHDLMLFFPREEGETHDGWTDGELFAVLITLFFDRVAFQATMKARSGV